MTAEGGGGGDDEVESQPESPSGQWYGGGDDNPTTTDRELKGWYCYGIAAEVFAVTGAGSFLPVTLEQLARENGVLYSDRSSPCVAAAVNSTANSTASALQLMVRAATESDPDNNQCIVNLLGFEMTTSSFAMYTASVAVFVQALALVSISSLADYGSNRKSLLIMFAMVGSATSMCYIFIGPGVYPMAALLAVLAITCLGCSFVMLNSFLPVIAANHPAVATLSTPVSQLSNQISARGVGLGYAAAVFVQLCSLVLLFLTSKEMTSRTMPLRLVLLLAGVWWCAFSIPTAFWLRNRPGPALPASLKRQHASSSRLGVAASYLTFAWYSVYQTLKLALSLSQTRIFLLAWFLLSDATTTVSSTAILFARTELGLSPVGIACLSITATSSGIAGSVLWPALSRRAGWSTTKQTIIACLCLMETIPVYGLLGFIPAVRALGWLGLQQAWEIFPLAVVHGVAMGGISSYCRSLFGQLVPPVHEAAFFALFAITDKGSSAIGPAIVGRIVDRTGSIRPAFWLLLVLVALPMLILARVSEVRGRHEAVQAAEAAATDHPATELSTTVVGPTHGHSQRLDVEQREALMADSGS